MLWLVVESDLRVLKLEVGLETLDCLATSDDMEGVDFLSPTVLRLV